ncbi:MAG: flavodoxin family protein [Candidatus Hermodarchaeota archaeon]
MVYHTRSGNTKLLAEKIKERLEFLNINVEFYQDINFKNFDSIKAFDILGFGSPTHYYNIAKEFREFLLKIANFNLRGKKLIVFATGSTKNGPPKICKDITKILNPTEIQAVIKISCVKKPTKEIDLRIEKAISEAILL